MWRSNSSLVRHNHWQPPTSDHAVGVSAMSGSSLRRTSISTGTSWSPVWSPDGKYLAFYSDRDGVANLWLWDRSMNRLHLASNAIVRPFFNSEVARWSSDSRQVL